MLRARMPRESARPEPVEGRVFPLPSMITMRDALRRGSRALAGAGSEEATLEAELLLAHALSTDRAHLYQRLSEQLPADAGAAFDALLQRRIAHEPTPYITGHKEFYGLDFAVTPAAIIPRPETETLVELVLTFVRTRDATRETRVVDVGVGCGAIAVALAANLPEAVDIIAIDVSTEALALAQRNAERNGVGQRIRFLEGDLLGPLDDPVTVIAANLPYVRADDFGAAPPEIREHEPRLGLVGGADGLDLIRRLLSRAPARLVPGGALFAEIGEEQGEAARRLAEGSFPRARIEVAPDLSGMDRVLVVRT